MLVDGVTKLTKMHFTSQEEEQAENYRKMIIAMATDIRVILIKLCDRLHNMHTLCYLSKQKQIQKAKETLEVYAPLAHRLGIHNLKWQLEDLSFASLHPRKYQEIQKWVAQRRADREDYVDEAAGYLNAELEKAGIVADITGRAKHFYSIYMKMSRGGKEFNEIFDLTGLRVLVDSIKDCYGAVGIIHSVWKPIPGPLQGLHRDAQVQPVPVAAHHGHRPRRQAAGDPDPHLRHAPDGGVRGRRALALQGARRPRPGQARLAAPDDGVAVRDGRPARVHGHPAGRPLRGRGVRLHAQGRRQEPGCREHAHRLRLRRAHRRRQPHRRRQGQRAHRAAAHEAQQRRHRRGHHQQVEPRALPRLARHRQLAAGAAEDPPALPPRAARGLASTPAATSCRRRCAARACRRRRS